MPFSATTHTPQHTRFPLLDKLHFPFLSIFAEFNTLSSSGWQIHPVRQDETDTFTHLSVFNGGSCDRHDIGAVTTTVWLQ